jgi:hypothetical protein
MAEAPRVSGQDEDILYDSIEKCLEQTFECDVVKRGCTVALKDLDWRGFEIDFVGYSTANKGLYIVEAKNVTLIDSDGIAAAVGEIVIDMAGLPIKEVLESIRQYAGLDEKEISSAHFYIALPNFVGSRAEKKLHPTGLSLLKGVHKMLSGWVGVLEVHDLNMPARVVKGLESKFMG